MLWPGAAMVGAARPSRVGPRLEVEAMAPRYYTEFSLLMRLPGVREFLAWNCALLLRRR